MSARNITSAINLAHQIGRVDVVADQIITKMRKLEAQKAALMTASRDVLAALQRYETLPYNLSIDLRAALADAIARAEQ